MPARAGPPTTATVAVMKSESHSDCSVFPKQRQHMHGARAVRTHRRCLAASSLSWSARTVHGPRLHSRSSAAALSAATQDAGRAVVADLKGRLALGFLTVVEEGEMQSLGCL